MMLVRFFVALIIAPIAFSQSVSATEWRYCLAASEEEHKVYLSGTFVTNADAWSTDSAFEKVLMHDGLRYDAIQCPRADDENAIMTMLQGAVAYNKKIGRKIIYKRWEPAH